MSSNYRYTISPCQLFMILNRRFLPSVYDNIGSKNQNGPKKKIQKLQSCSGRCVMSKPDCSLRVSLKEDLMKHSCHHLSMKGKTLRLHFFFLFFRRSFRALHQQAFSPPPPPPSSTNNYATHPSNWHVSLIVRKWASRSCLKCIMCAFLPCSQGPFMLIIHVYLLAGFRGAPHPPSPTPSNPTVHSLIPRTLKHLWVPLV